MPFGEDGHYGGVLWGEPEKRVLGMIDGQYRALEVLYREPKRCPHCGKDPDEPPLELWPEGGADWQERGGLFVRNSWREPFELALGPLLQADEAGRR